QLCDCLLVGLVFSILQPRDCDRGNASRLSESFPRQPPPLPGEAEPLAIEHGTLPLFSDDFRIKVARGIVIGQRQPLAFEVEVVAVREVDAFYPPDKRAAFNDRARQLYCTTPIDD